MAADDLPFELIAGPVADPAVHDPARNRQLAGATPTATVPGQPPTGRVALPAFRRTAPCSQHGAAHRQSAAADRRARHRQNPGGGFRGGVLRHSGVQVPGQIDLHRARPDVRVRCRRLSALGAVGRPAAHAGRTAEPGDRRRNRSRAAGFSAQTGALGSLRHRRRRRGVDRRDRQGLARLSQRSAARTRPAQLSSPLRPQAVDHAAHGSAARGDRHQQRGAPTAGCLSAPLHFPPHRTDASAGRGGRGKHGGRGR